MKQDVYRYATTNMLPEAELALLDEFFNAGEFLHGPVLSMMAERAFDNPTRTPVPLITLFSASNRVPRPESVISRAAWDRFPLRVIVEYVSDADFLRLLDLTPPPPARPMITKTELQQVQRAVAAIPIPQATKEAMLTLRRELRGKGVSISDRRWMQSRAILRAHALLEGRGTVEEDDLMVFQYMWEEPEQLTEIRGICARLANPLNAKAIEFGDQAHSVYQAAKQAIQRNADSDAQSNAAFDAVKKLKAIATRLHALRETALNEGRNPARIEHVLRQVEGYRDEMAEQALGKIAPRQ
jgi:MoxR-like ATPase